MWDIKLKPGQSIYFTSDTHYSHKNICRGVSEWRTAEGKVPVEQTRDFPTLDKMNAAIVNNINSRVGQEDILVHLGDWSFGGFDSIQEFRNRLVCNNVYLLYGNHDHHIERNRGSVQTMFTATAQYKLLKVSTVQSKTYEFILTHYPICSWHDMSKGRMHLFGHVHLPSGKNVMKGRSMDVGMDSNSLTPYSLQEVVNLLENRPKVVNSLPQDHHEKDLKVK